MTGPYTAGDRTLSAAYGTTAHHRREIIIVA